MKILSETQWTWFNYLLGKTEGYLLGISQNADKTSKIYYLIEEWDVLKDSIEKNETINPNS